MKYLVTGGAGFIGSHLATELATRASSRHDEIVVLDNFSSGRRENLTGLPVRIIAADIRDLNALRKAVQGVDTVFHQAALCSVAKSMEDPVGTHDVNVTGTLNVLEAARLEGVRRVVLASSSAVYGDSEALPKHEGMATAPMSPYAISKLIGEEYCQLYWQTYGLETVALRYFNVFGPRQAPDSDYAAVIPKFLDALISNARPQVYGDGSQTRDFTFVQDVVEANLAAAISPTAAGQVMNIACGQRWSLLDLLNCLEDALQCDATPVFHERRAGDILHSQASIEKAQRLINFAPQVSLADGLKETVDWFLARLATDGTSAKQTVPLRYAQVG
jgi:nucleoside-diphosphate-sugar epimerase